MGDITGGADDQAARNTLLGHPRGLAWLSLTEFWERFSYYGMQALLVLYLTHRLLLPGHVEHVLGFATFRRALLAVYGPLSIQALASVIFGLFTGLVWLAPIAGGVVADRFTGRTAAITAGALLMCAGHLAMTLEQAFLPALACLLVGLGLFKGNLASQVGGLYAADDPREASAFQIYNLGIQIAAIVTPIVCGTLGEVLGWHWGFAAAGGGMIVALVLYRRARRWLPPEAPREARAAQARRPLDRADWIRVAAMLALLPVFGLCMNVSTQVGNAYVIWAERCLDLRILGAAIPVTWLQSLDGLSTAAAILLSLAFWRGWEARRGPVHDTTKLVVGAACFTLAPLILAAASLQFDASGRKVGLFYAPAFELVLNLGWANLFPIAMALYSRAAPPGIVSTIMGLVYLQVFIASLLTGWMGTLLERMPGPAFWLLHGALAGVGFLVLLASRGALRRLLAPAGDAEPALSP